MSYIPIQYPSNWDDIRKERLELDGYQCQNCGTKRRVLHIHHKVPLSKGGSNDLENLITLCNDCHEVEHSALEDEMRLHELSNIGYISVLKCWTCGKTFSHLTGLASCPYCNTFLKTENVAKPRQTSQYHQLKYGVEGDRENDYHRDGDEFVPVK